MPEIDHADIVQLYCNSVIMYDGRPCFVKYYNNQSNDITLYDLYYQREFDIKFKRSLFKPVRGRIGYVNHNGLSAYLSRAPIRQYSIGLTYNNLKCSYNQFERLNKLNRKLIDELTSLQIKGIADAIANKYPSLDEAFKIAKKTNGSCAFDKQFAIDYDARIYYKSKYVGDFTIDKGISFNEQLDYLKSLMEFTDEKCCTTLES